METEGTAPTMSFLSESRARTGNDKGQPRIPADGRPSYLRSKVTNGARLFVSGAGDGNSAWARRWRDLIELHVNDGGGADRMSEAEVSLCKRCATLEIQLESMEAAMSEGKIVDVEQYARIASHLRRIFETTGLKRAMVEVDDYWSRPPPPARAPSFIPDDGDDAAEAATLASEAPSLGGAP
jgi:hypothetical protein